MSAIQLKIEHLVLDNDNPRITVASWDRQKRIFASPDDHSYIDVGFATFFLNRTNRSGILNGGPMGGRDQSGPWKINARYNADELIFRIGVERENEKSDKADS